MAGSLKSKMLRAFQLQGLTLKMEASRHLIEVFTSIPTELHENALEKLVSVIHQLPLTSALINKKILEEAINECMCAEDEDINELLAVIGAFDVPQFTYRKEQKKLVLKSSLGPSTPSLFSEANCKADLYLERYKIIQQRAANHQLFAPQTFISSVPDQQSYTLKPIEFLLGSSSRQGNVISLGMLTQMKEGKYYLEDPTGYVQLDLSKTNYRGGLFTDHCFVLAEGYYEDHIFHVHFLGFPPPEPAKITRQHFGNTNFFGGPSSTSVKVCEKLKRLEDKHQDAMFIFVSDVWLDQIKVLQKLRVLFTGYSQVPPSCFVLMGNFFSSPLNISQTKVIKECFKKLSDLIGEFPALVEHSYFVFVPGPDDPGLSNIFPRPPIPKFVVNDFQAKVPKAIFTTNPCRIQFCTQEIVIFREDIISKMCRNCIYFPWEHQQVNLPNLLVKTLIANAHLLPLPLVVAPIYWEFDSSLWLYPLPDLVVCGDKYDPYVVTNTDCTFLNPGSFPKTGFKFKVYVPGLKQIEDSQIDDPSD